jgi:hypothetical protein
VYILAARNLNLENQMENEMKLAREANSLSGLSSRQANIYRRAREAGATHEQAMSQVQKAIKAGRA